MLKRVCVYLFASNWYSTDFLLVKQQMAHLIQRILLSKCYMYSHSQHMHINMRFVGTKEPYSVVVVVVVNVCVSEFNLQVKQFGCCHSSLFGDPIRFLFFFRLLYYVYAVMKCNQYFGARFYYVSLISTHKYLFFSFTYPIFFLMFLQNKHKRKWKKKKKWKLDLGFA